MSEIKYKQYAESKEGVFIGFETLSEHKYSMAKYKCKNDHIFYLRRNFIRWCPICAIDIRKQKLIESNKSRKKNDTSVDNIKKILSKYGAYLTNENVNPTSIHEKLDITLSDGSKKSVLICSILKEIGIGKKALKTTKTLETQIAKAKKLCEEAKYQFVDFISGPRSAFSNSKIVFKNKQGIRTAQVAWFLKGRFRENQHISKPVKQIEKFLQEINVDYKLEYYVPLLKEDYEKWEKYYDMKQQERDTPYANVSKHKRRLVLDIFLPKYNMAIEYHGAKWHDALRIPSKKYECEFKRDCCINKGIHLIQIWEHEWEHKSAQLKSIIKNKLGLTPNKVNARDCIVREIDKHEAKNFLNTYHLQGMSHGMISAHGMYHNNILLGVVAIKKERDIDGKGLYLDRLAFHPDYVIRGSLGKLNKYLLSKYKHLYTLIDLRLHDPKNWIASGWELERIMPRSYSYFNSKNRTHYDKRKFKTIPTTFNFDGIGSKEDAYVKSLGTFYKLWNCGRARLVLQKKPLMLLE